MFTEKLCKCDMAMSVNGIKRCEKSFENQRKHSPSCWGNNPYGFYEATCSSCREAGDDIIIKKIYSFEIGDIVIGNMNRMEYEVLKFNNDGTIDVLGLMFKKIYKNREKNNFSKKGGIK